MRQLVSVINTPSRRKLLSGFWSNIAVAWFVAAFIGEATWLTRLVYIVNIFLSLTLALIFEE